MTVKSTKPEAHAVAKLLLEACELGVTRGRPSHRSGHHRLASWFAKHSLPLELTFSSGHSTLRALCAWFALVVSSCIALHAIKQTGFVRPEDLDAYFPTWICLITLCFVLARPSALGFAGWHHSDMAASRVRFPQLLELNEHEIPTVRFFVSHAEAAMRRRLTTMWWGIGVVWAIAAYLVKQGLESKDGNLLAIALVPVVLSLFCASLVASYSRSASRVHGVAQGLLLEREAQLRHLHGKGQERRRRFVRN